MNAQSIRPALALAALACGLPGAASPAEPAVSSSGAGPAADLTGVCVAISPDVVAEVLGRDLVSDPAPFEDELLGSGCQYDAGQDASGNAYFAYVTLASADLYEQNKLAGFEVTPVEGVGDEAFTANGPDALQLWVLVEGRGAVMVAIGDQPNLEGAKQLAPYLIAALPPQ